MSDVRYSRDEWDGALEAAELWEFCPVDSGEKHGPLAQWIADQVIDHPKVDRDPELIIAAFDRLTESGEDEFSPERLIDVLNTGRA